MAATRQGLGIFSTYWKRYLSGQARYALTWLTLMVRGWSIAATVSGGGGLEKLVDHPRRSRLRDLGEGRDIEELFEPVLRSFALVALPRHDAEQVPALGLGHRLGAIARPGRSGGA